VPGKSGGLLCSPSYSCKDIRRKVIRYAFIFILISCFLVSAGWAEEDTQIKDQKARDSYSLGYDFGSNLRSREITVDIDVLLSAVRDGLSGKKPVLSADEIRGTLNKLKRTVMVAQDRRYRKLAAKNLEAGREFLQKNKKKEGVQTLTSGLQYKVLTEGAGRMPEETDKVTVDYRGTLIDGTEFDSSARRGGPISVSVNGVIRCWTEALRHMKVGSKWQVFCPYHLAYGEHRFGRIPPDSTLIFELKLMSIGGRTENLEPNRSR
jgi:FKBP-type peptidyl-prolyl cis-trans isomerase FklB